MTSDSLFCCFLMLVCSVFSLPSLEISEGHRLYTGYKVLRAHPQSDQQRAALLQLEDGEFMLAQCLQIRALGFRK